MEKNSEKAPAITAERTIRNATRYRLLFSAALFWDLSENTTTTQLLESRQSAETM